MIYLTDKASAALDVLAALDDSDLREVLGSCDAEVVVRALVFGRERNRGGTRADLKRLIDEAPPPCEDCGDVPSATCTRADTDDAACDCPRGAALCPTCCARQNEADPAGHTCGDSCEERCCG